MELRPSLLASSNWQNWYFLYNDSQLATTYVENFFAVGEHYAQSELEIEIDSRIDDPFYDPCAH